MSNKKKKGPTLFFSSAPQNQSMQEVYSSRHDWEENEPKVNKNKRKSLPAQREDFFEPISIENDKKESDLEKRSTFKRVKPFKEMELTERLEYLLNFPKVLPPVPCVFYTAGHTYQGYLTEYENNQVTIHLPDQTTKTLDVEDIKNITMIGIKS